MNLTQEWQTFLIAVLAALIPAVPMAVGLLLTYMKTLENKFNIEQRPTQDSITTQLDDKLKRLGVNVGGTDGDRTTDDK